MSRATSPLEASHRLDHGAAVLAACGAVLLAGGLQMTAGEPSGRWASEPEGPAPLTATAALNTTPLPGPAQPAPEVRSPSAAVTAPTEGAAAVTPTRVRIPVIGVNATLVELGLDSDGKLEVPDDWDRSGWYTGRSVPGEIGTSVVVGHVDSAANGAAVFYHLDELLPGDLVEVVRSDGSIAQFIVSEVTRFSKNDFPTDRVYTPTERPSLRLITCGGAFDRKARSYTDNVVVFADYLDMRQPPQHPS